MIARSSTPVELGIPFAFVPDYSILASLFDEFDHIVRVAGAHSGSVRELIPARGFRNASFESAFGRISSKVVGAIEQARREQRARFLEPNSGQHLKVITIHAI